MDALDSIEEQIQAAAAEAAAAAAEAAATVQAVNDAYANNIGGETLKRLDRREEHQQTNLQQLRRNLEQLRAKEEQLRRELSGGASVDNYFTGPDYTGPFLKTLFTSNLYPPTFDALPETLPLLKNPLPMLKSTYDLHLLSSNDPSRFRRLAAIPTMFQPARALAEHVSSMCNIGMQDGGEIFVVVDVVDLVIKSMRVALRALDVQAACTGDQTDPSGTTQGQQRPDVLLLIKHVGMFKIEAKRYSGDFNLAVTELHEKMASWSTTLHGLREYMLCCATAGTRLQFYAVTRGGEVSKSVSREFNTSLVLDRLEIIHTTLVIFDIMLRQLKHQMPPSPVPLGATFRRGATSIRYFEDYVQKTVKLADFANNDPKSLQKVYDCIASLQNEPGLDHPRGILRPIKVPVSRRGFWCVEMPLAKLTQLETEADWKALAKDVLHGLKAFHEKRIVHRDVRAANIMQKDGSYFLIDFEHSGIADELPPFHPLRHWPRECQQPGASYATSADIYSLGNLMPDIQSPPSTLASNFREQLLHRDPKQRLSAEAALRHSWFTTS